MKHTTKIIVLLVMLAATLFLTGCPKEPEEVDPNAEKGSWVKKSFSKPYTKDSNSLFYFSTDATSEKVSFDFIQSEDTAKFAEKYDTTTSPFEENDIVSFTSNAPYDDAVLGFIADVKVESSNSETWYGFGFNYDENYNYYEIVFAGNKFRVRYRKVVNGAYENTVLADFSANTAIKTDGSANTVKVATINSGDIKIYVNDTWIYTINSPAAATGKARIIGSVTYEDIQTGANPVKITYKFNKFQQ